MRERATERQLRCGSDPSAERVAAEKGTRRQCTRAEGEKHNNKCNRAAELIESGVLGLKCGWVWVSV